MAKKKRDLTEALKSSPMISEELPEAEAIKEDDPRDKAAKQAAEYVEIKEKIKMLEKEAEILKAEFEPAVKPLAKNGVWEHKGVQARWVEVKTQSTEPTDFYELAGDAGLPFLTVSVPKAKKAIEAGSLAITQKQLDEISSFSSYERFEAKIVSAAQAAELFELPF